MASLLRALGSDAGSTDLDRALALRTIRGYRARFLGSRQNPSDRYFPDMIGDGDMVMLLARSRYYAAQGMSDTADSLMPWHVDLEMLSADRVRQSDQSLLAPPRGTALKWRRNVRIDVHTGEQCRHQARSGRSRSGRLAFGHRQ